MPVAVAAATAADGLRSVGVLAHLVRELDQRLRAARRADGVNLTELSVLSCVEAGNDAPGCIARAMRLDAARMTRVTGRLVALGYLQREADADDRRRWRIHLTWLGAERLAMGRADVDVALRQVAAGLSLPETNGLLASLESIGQALTPRCDSRGGHVIPACNI